VDQDHLGKDREKRGIGSVGKNNQSSGQGNSAAAAAPALDRETLQGGLAKAGNPEECCAQLSQLFGVRSDEVALLRLENGLLRFLFPVELATAGSIPISSSSAVAAHTAVSRKIELFNNFTQIKHASIFESIKPGGEPGEQLRPATIQKLMSAPVLDKNDHALGVIQICRKGFDLASAGPDFTLDDLQKLEVAAKTVAQADFMREGR
jgi:hypothetical protein